MSTIVFTLITLLTVAVSAAFQTTAPPTPDLSTDEIAGLQYMREEEKLAHDVYAALYDTWGVPIFANIAAAETTHASAVLRLLDHYDIPDPAAGNPPGVFADPGLQALHDQLVADGRASLAAAFYAGATIEETDIADLQASLATSRHADITAVYRNLLRGSENHLRAFVGQWERTTGQTYQPQVLDADAYAAIIGGTNGNRPGRRGGRWGQLRLPTPPAVRP